MYLTLVVKVSKSKSEGSQRQFARNAAAVRRIAATVRAQGPDFVTLACDMRSLEDVARWFWETSNSDMVPGEGYPEGSCLLFSHHEEAM